MSEQNSFSIRAESTPNLENYDSMRASFRWEQVRAELDGLPGGRGLNIAWEAVGRYAQGPQRDHVALRWLGKDGHHRDISYHELDLESNRFAHVLRKLGEYRGDTVFSLCGRIPELYFALLGTLKNTSVFCPLFSAFGPEPIFQRLSKGKARILVTTESLYRKKVEALRDRLPDLRYVVLVDTEEHSSKDVLSLHRLMEFADTDFIIPDTAPEDPALLHFTSGTTGMPKGAVHVHQAVLTHYITGKYVLDLHPTDIYWCTADPGWVTGTSYGIIAPLTLGVTSIIDEQEFEPEHWYHVLESQKVSVWYTAPTALRMLMRMDLLPREKYDLRHLRVIHSVGEPLNPEVIEWGQKAFGLTILDNWWQTETGGIMIANYPSVPVVKGSMGKPLPGVEAGIVRREADGTVSELTEPGKTGELALRPGWPSMFRTYLGEEARYQKCFVGGWYLSGDLAMRDAAGYFHFVGRADDIIKTAGHIVGPFEVESALIEHPAVAEAAVIGKPNDVIGELVKAFVTLRPGYEGNEALIRDILGFARQKLGSAVSPKELEIRDSLPRTRSGKIMRRLLKARELGLPEGDTSTME